MQRKEFKVIIIIGGKDRLLRCNHPTTMRCTGTMTRRNVYEIITSFYDYDYRKEKERFKQHDLYRVKENGRNQT